MSDERTHDDDDSRLKAVLRAVEADAPLPDAALLDALRQRSAEAFLSNEDRTGKSAHPTTTTPTQTQLPPAQPAAHSKRRHPMVTLAIRGLCVASATVAMLAAWLVPMNPGSVSYAAPFSQMIDELRGAGSLHLRVVRDGQTAEVWVRAPGLVRREESPQKYEIAAGSRLWRVDEETNTATETDSPWFSAPDRQVDLVALLDVGVRDATALLNSRPRERSQFDGRECFVYRAQVEAASERIELEGFVDVQNRQLAGIRAKRGPNVLLAEMRLIALNEDVADEKFVVAKSLTEDGRIGKVSDAQGIAVIRPMLAKRWTPLGRDLLLKPGDWLRTELRGANALKVTLSSEVELTLGPGTLVECLSPTKARLHSGEVQVNVGRVSNLPEKAVDKKDGKGEGKAEDGQVKNLPHEFVLLAPREGSRVFQPGTKQLVRVDRDEKLVDVPQTPVWLAGFEGTSNNESLGSLIVKLPDGRNEPLTVGYHKVSVEIRDQIARTTIEESFVNHTPSRLEGIFHFPLPQDASISRFGMWIGNDLVEADIVEKQRAREIYETILRERRDPGLLEWTAGNLFKARVFPIEAFSEKRVKIVYTQVLPLRANRYRYSYGLRSDLLRTKPLRELSLTVTVNSALPLKGVTCPTHTVRTQQTGHSAQVEFAAQEYSPNRDFEVVCEIDAKQSDVVVIPHRRGDDGYLLVQLTLPGADGNWQRELLPDGKPLNVVLLCDTSASMDSEKRKQQADFVATVLSSLGADDRFLLGACDVGVEWFVPVPSPPAAGERARVRGPNGEPTPEDSSKPKAKPQEKPPHPNPLPQSRGRGDKAEDKGKEKEKAEVTRAVPASNVGLVPIAENIAQAMSFLDRRASLGWTNLDRAFAEVIKKAPADAQVIYIGDGIVSAGDTDPARFVKRLGQLVGRVSNLPVKGDGAKTEGETKADGQVTNLPHEATRRSFHAVTVGNITEAVVLKGIATVGGGSVRSIGGEQTALVVAKELLNEIAQPGLREVNVEFRGLKVAAVYPERLPNVAAGTQQILVGRYLPEDSSVGRALLPVESSKDQAVGKKGEKGTGKSAHPTSQVGEIIVTGKRGTEAVRYVAKINFKDAEEGNSFIPRLWARGHLDHLLAQGQAAAVKDDIIGLSEQFHIITPYTSLLVLETDADRERFGVKRRYEMRDGERFFAQGRDNANFELVQQQMKRAGDWRLGIRRQVLRSLAGLGRNPQAFQQQVQVFDEMKRLSGRYRFISDGVSVSNGPVSFSESAPMSGSGGGGSHWDFAGPSGGFGGGGLSDSFEFESFGLDGNKDQPFGTNGRMMLGDGEEMAGVSDSRDKAERFSKSDTQAFDSDGDGLSLGFAESDRKADKELGTLHKSMMGNLEDVSELNVSEFAARERGGDLSFYDNGFGRGTVGLKAAADSGPSRLRGLSARNEVFSLGGALSSKRKVASKLAIMGRYYQGYQPDTTSWLNNLFPALPARPGKAAPALPDPEGWSPEALALSRSLLRVDALAKLPGGLELKRTVDSFDPRWKRQSAKNTDLVLYSPTGWLTRTLDLDDQTVVHYATAQERGVFSLALLLGRVRSSAASELAPGVLGLTDSSLTAIHESYRVYRAKVEPAGENRVKLLLTQKDSTYEQHLLIDTARHVILKNESFQDGKVIGATTFDDFVEVAGTWVARKSIVTDNKERKTNETTLDVKAITAEEYAARMAAELAFKPAVRFLHLPYSKLAVARQHVADGAAGFDDRITMVRHYASLQQWDELLKQVDAIELLAGIPVPSPPSSGERARVRGPSGDDAPDTKKNAEKQKDEEKPPHPNPLPLRRGRGDKAEGEDKVGLKPGVRWIRTAALVAMRRNEEARQRFLGEAKQLAAAKSQDEVYLAEFIHGQAVQVGTGSEMLDLVNLLKPIYERQAAELDVMVRWQEKMLSTLDALGRSEEALALRKAMAEKAPWHVHWQQDVAQRMRNAGQYDAAEKWLRTEIARDIERPDYEDETLRGSLTDLFRTRGQWDRLLTFTTEWIAKNPESSSWNSAYAQHVSALVYNDKLDAANALVEQWLKEARVEGKLTATQRARLETAINFAQGNAYNLSFQRADERWFGLLAETVRFFVRHPHHGDIANRIFNNSYFQQSEDCDRLRGEFLNQLRSGLADLTPGQLNFLVNSALGGRLELVEPINDRKQLQAHEVPLDIWKKIAAELRMRWSKTEDRNDRDSLGTTLSGIYSSRFYDTEALPFLRERIATAPADLKPGYRDLLFTDLLARPWTDELEQEAFQTLRLLSRANEPDSTLSVQLPALHRLVDAMLTNRSARDEKLLRDAGEVNKLTRTELAKKRAEARKASRVAFALRLTAEAGKEEQLAVAALARVREDVAKPRVLANAAIQLAAWLRMEQMWLDVQLDQNLDKVEERCWVLLGEVPPKPEVDEDGDEKDGRDQREVGDDEPGVAGSDQMREAIDGLLKQRAFVTVMNLAARRKAAPASIDRVLKYIDAGIAQSSPHAPREESRVTNAAATPKNAAATKDAPPALGFRHAERDGYFETRAAWRATKFQMLVALDRPDDLERDLRTWIREDQSTSPWRQSLARLLAERGKLDEAIQLFESAEKDKLLSAGDYRMLSDWYLVSNRRSDHERAKLEVFQQMPEGNLGNSLYAVRNRWHQNGVTLPSELDENTLLTFKALFAKSANPENYLWQLREIYAASRDFRLLQMLPDAVLGRSPQQVYAFLQSLNSQVLVELRNEATADEILKVVGTLRVPNGGGEGDGTRRVPATLARTPTDLRALDLLEALVERKSSEVLNQPGPHVQACVAALRRAFARDWQPGEPRLMSGFLYSLGGITNGEIVAEQLRELRALQAQAPAASRDHLFITNDLCNLLGWSYGKRDEAIAMMEIEVRDYARANEGQWPHEDNGILGSFVSLYEGGGKHVTGEAVLLKWIAATKHDEQRKWLRDRLMSLYNHALEHKGEVTLGSGATLFDKIIDLGLKEIDDAPDEHVRYNVVTRMCSTFDIAHRNKIGDFAGRLAKFVFESLPKILKQQQSQYRNTVSAPVYITGVALSPKLALQYVVERLEQYPQRFEVQWDNGWQGLGYELARRREVAAAELGDLAPRVLALAIRELKRDLRMGEARNQYIYYKHSSHFWAEKAPDFAKAANEVYAEKKTSGRRVRYIANYLRSGLELRARAIEILMIANNDGLLDESAQAELVTFLQNEGRYAESIPLLEGLMKAQPDSMTYRTQLMAAYHHSQRPEQLATLLKQTDAHFHADGRWTEGNIYEIGKACLGCNLYELSVGYLNEAISLHLRDYGARGLNDATLSYQYDHLADAQSSLGRTKEAVDAASAGIVCWGPRTDQRGHAIRKLNQVLNNAKDLDDYVKHLDTEAAKTGQDSPILRKTIGQAYQAKGNLPLAIAQYELALALQPLDREVHQALIICYDGSQQPDKATRQLMALIDFDRHDLKLFTQLAERLKGNEAEAERAATSIIEAAPNEAENHAALAELRQQQNRWDEAIPHWEQVAELRRLEPTGLLKLAAAQVQQKRWEDARKSINKLNKTEWPSRFNNVRHEAAQLEAQLPK